MRRRLSFVHVILMATFVAVLVYQGCGQISYISPHKGDESSFVGPVDPEASPTPIPIPTATPTPMPTPQDPYAAQVTLLMHMDSVAGQNPFVDSTGRHSGVTFGGNPQLSTMQSKFGGSSLFLDGSSYLMIPNSPDWDMTAVDATIEMWIYPLNSKPSGLVGQSPVTADFQWYLGSATVLYMQYNGGGQDISGGTITMNAWNHVAVSKNSGTTRLFINGLMVAAAAVNPFSRSTNALYIGALNTSSFGNQYVFQGFIDELRITRGVGRYMSNFTPPTSAYPYP